LSGNAEVDNAPLVAEGRANLDAARNTATKVLETARLLHNDARFTPLARHMAVFEKSQMILQPAIVSLDKTIEKFAEHTKALTKRHDARPDDRGQRDIRRAQRRRNSTHLGCTRPYQLHQ
jgi:hypothetical protein